MTQLNKRQPFAVNEFDPKETAMKMDTNKIGANTSGYNITSNKQQPLQSVSSPEVHNVFSPISSPIGWQTIENVV